MAVVYRCDRCKAEFERGRELFSLQLPRLNYHGEFENRNSLNDDSEHTTYTKELCAKCIRLVRDQVDTPLTKSLL